MSSPTVDVVIVSHKRDLGWLSYSLQLWDKFWLTPGRRIVRLEENCREVVKDWGVRADYRYVKKWPDGYTFQMYQKMIADDFSAADIIICADSDQMLTRPASIEDILVDGKPAIEYTEWDGGVAEQKWRNCTTRVMGEDLDRDYMVLMPCVYWRETFSRTRQQIVNATGQGFFEAVYSDRPWSDPRSQFMSHPMTFADYEALNLHAVKHQADKYHLRSISDRPADWPFRLFWSHGHEQWPEHQAYLRRLIESSAEPIPAQ
jgi:hypothetical protein